MNAITAACKYSIFLQRLINNSLLDSQQLETFAQQPIVLENLQNFADWQGILVNLDGEEMARQLRLLRRIVVASLAVRDLSQQADLQEVVQSMTLFADFAVNMAADFAHAYYVKFYGEPIGAASGEPQRLCVIAMGKMGGGELNVSSDIDLIFTYPENGETNGKKNRTNQEFFTKVGQKIIALLNDITADGQVFRVDMRLRPDGDSGALVINETALEQYLITQGREWERYAWTKARVISPFSNNIKDLVRPFVYRRYLDFNAYDAMRHLHGQIRAEVAKKGMENNIKLGAGGIREVEFIAQIFQMIRGGRMKSLQLKGTQETLKELARLELLPENTANDLLDAYRFLRNTEHRLQYWDDNQTQTLPENEEQQALLAQSMDFDSHETFSGCLKQHRETVRHIFDTILGEPEQANDASFSIDNSSQILQKQGFSEEVASRLTHLYSSKKYLSLPANDARRFDIILPQAIAACSKFDKKSDTILRLLDFLESILRRSSYLALMHEYPDALAKVAEIMSKSSWISGYLMRHPILLDELLDTQLMSKNPPDEANLSAELAKTDNMEDEMDTLRHFQHAHSFRLSVQDLAGLWTIEAISDELSLLADCVLRQAVHRAWHYLPKKHTDTPHFAVIAYGKLGGKELGYASDLDLVYVYDDPDPAATETYTRLANRLTSWLTATTTAGGLYNIDLRLRPNGDSGFAATSLDAFLKYQQQSAWIWEHQALSRARFVCGDEKIGEQFEAIRRQILMQNRNKDELKQAIINMLEKMYPTHPPVDCDIKYAHGGVVDVEFIVQYLVLQYSHQYPDLTGNLGNIALLRMAAERGLIDSELSQKTQNAYREYRRIQHNKALCDEEFILNNSVLAHYQAVKTLWQEVFGK